MKIVACGLQAPAKFVYMYKHLLFSYTVHILIRNIVIVEHTRDRKQLLWSNQSALTYTWAAKA